MRRLISLLLACALVLSGCAQNAETSSEGKALNAVSASSSEAETGKSISQNQEGQAVEEKTPEFDSLSDPELLEYVENTIYAELSDELSSEEYRIENVSTTYISKEYLEEAAYNSQSNIWFGYTLDELKAQYNGTPYVVTLGDSGETVVIPFEDYDDTYDKVIKNIVIGTGVIVICVTVAIVSGGVGAPAVSMVFAGSAKYGAIFATSSAAISGVVSTAVTGAKTGNLEESLKEGALSASENFKWGAITGAVTGGATELVALKAATKGGLTANEAAFIMKDSDLSANFTKQIHSMEEYNELRSIEKKGGLTIKEMQKFCMSEQCPLEIVKLFKSKEEGAIYFDQAHLVSETVGGKTALIRSIDLNYKSELDGKIVTNLERMRKGRPAIDPATGKPYELHHIGQSVDSPLAILTKAEHMEDGNNIILHDPNIKEGVHATLPNGVWEVQKKEFWKAMAILLG